MIPLKCLREAKVWTYKDRVFITDMPDSIREDAVFPVCMENRYFADNLAVREGDRVLDLCTGSGILAIMLANVAREVVAVDINPRATKFAMFNAALNEVDGRIHFLEGELFSPVEGQKFDLITVNPPFEPIPTGLRYYLHSDGGPAGCEVVDRVCERVAGFLKAGGVFQMVGYFQREALGFLDRLRSSFSSVRAQEVAGIDTARFKAYLESRLRKMNPGTKIAIPTLESLVCLFVTATKRAAVSVDASDGDNQCLAEVC